MGECETSGGRRFWLYAALIAAIAIPLLLLPGGEWYWELMLAAFTVEIGFRLVERVRRRR